jgi:hypothetical protein
MAIKIGNVAQEYRRKFDDFSKGSTLGEEMAETLRDGDEGFEIRQSDREKVERWMDKNLDGESIDEKELLALYTSDILKYFVEDHDGGYSHNSDALYALLEGKLGVAITSKANRIAEVMTNVISDGDEDFWINPISDKASDEAAALKAMALLNRTTEGRTYGETIWLDRETMDGIKSLRSTFAENLHDLEQFASRVYAHDSLRGELVAFVESLGGTVPASTEQ